MVIVIIYGVSVVLLDENGDFVVFMLDYEFDGLDSVFEEYNNICLDFWEIGLLCFLGGFNVGV